MTVADFPPPSIEAQIACVGREIAKRHSVYPRLVAAGKLTQKKADYEIIAMRAVLETLRKVQNDRD